MSDVRYTRGIMTMASAARYLEVPRQTFHRWARGYERGKPIIHVLDKAAADVPVTFISLVEAWVLEGLRRAGVRPQRIRPALEVLQKEFGREYVLTSPNLATDGIDVLWDFARTREGAGLIQGVSGQAVIREIVEDYLQYVTWDRDEPTVLRLRSCEPSKVVVDPARGFGQPRFGVAGARMIDVAAMLKAGEMPEVVADEFGISEADVRTTARILLGRAA
ncbi:MAG: DUF433 domain-containing protein [Mycobacterium sp.]